MSLIRCNYCDENVDTDYNAEHFDVEDSIFECVQEEQDHEAAINENKRRDSIKNNGNKE